MIEITPKTGPRAVAGIVENAWIDRIVKTLNENEERIKHFEEPIPLPAFDIPKMVETAKELAKDAFLKRQQQFYDDWYGTTIDEWQNEAVRTLRDDLARYAQRTNDDDLMEQIWQQWPELHPGRELTPAEKVRLIKLQLETDKAIDDLIKETKERLEHLWQLTKEEVEIIKETREKRRLIGNQVQAAVKYIYNYIQGWWLFKTGGASNSPVRFDKPKGWTDEEA